MAALKFVRSVCSKTTWSRSRLMTCKGLGVLPREIGARAEVSRNISAKVKHLNLVLMDILCRLIDGVSGLEFSLLIACPLSLRFDCVRSLVLAFLVHHCSLLSVLLKSKSHSSGSRQHLLAKSTLSSTSGRSTRTDSTSFTAAQLPRWSI